MNNKRYSISLRMTHPTRPAKWMEQAVGQIATDSRSIGEIRIESGGRVLGVNRESFCDFRIFPTQPGSFPFGIASAASILANLRTFFGEVRDAGGTAELFVDVAAIGPTNTAFELEPELLSKLATLGLRLSVEINSGQEA